MHSKSVYKATEINLIKLLVRSFFVVSATQLNEHYFFYFISVELSSIHFTPFLSSCTRLKP